MLPSPIVPLRPRGMTAAELEAVAGADLAEPLRRLEYAYATAELVVRELDERRPGGGTTGRGDGAIWKSALANDARAAASGRQPDDGWETAELIAGDGDRYAEALAAVNAIKIVAAETQENLDRTGINEAATVMGDSATAEWAEVAEAGWRARADKATAYQHQRTGDQALARFRQARRVAGWALGTPIPRTGGRDAKVDLTGVSLLPDGLPAASGFWLALGLFLEEGRRTWLELPAGVVWPSDMPARLLDVAMATPAQASGLLRRGVAEPTHTTRPSTETGRRLSSLNH